MEPEVKRDPIQDEELVVRWGMGPAGPDPLIRWSRLGSFLKHRFGRRHFGIQLDFRRLMQQVARGLPVYRLPYREHVAWPGTLMLLWDRSREMQPFGGDQRIVWTRLRREAGRTAVRVVDFRGAPDLMLGDAWPSGAAVLALSAMGGLEGIASRQEAWFGLGERLKRRGHPRLALNPAGAPEPALGRAWPTVPWDDAVRLSRHAGRSAVRVPGAIHDDHPQSAKPVERLLDLVSPALRVTPYLLRVARRTDRLGPGPALEWAAWFHPGMAASSECSCFAEESERLRRLARLGEDPPPHGFFEKLLVSQRGLSDLLQWETELRTLCIADEGGNRVAEIAPLLGRVVDRLRVLAVSPNSAEGRALGIAEWFEKMIERVPESLRAHPNLTEVLARGTALAQAFRERAELRLASGLQSEAAWDEWKRLRRHAVAPSAWRVVQHGTRILLHPDPTGLASGIAGFPLGRIQALSRRIRVTWRGGNQERVLNLGGGTEAVEVWGENPPEDFALETDRMRLEFVPLRRPDWMASWCQDGFGLRGEARVEDQMWAFRWIPAGEFVMGSPESEPGRLAHEGPTHRVTVSTGFWLGETPVTQAQWGGLFRSSASATAKPTGWFGRLVSRFTQAPVQEGPVADPSHFKGPDTLPVETVSLEDVQAACKQLSGRLGGVEVTLPTEAQWEYACRAGTSGPTYNGESLDVAGTLGWHANNAWNGVEVSNPAISSGRPQNVMLPKPGGTHRVGLLAPNPWGLLDMVGNVLEWCGGGMRAYSSGVVTDPEDGMSASGGVLRGGCWSLSQNHLRPAYRLPVAERSKGAHIGARLKVKQEMPVAQSGRSGAGSHPAPPAIRGCRVTQDRFGHRAEFQVGGVSFAMRWISPGTFWMGSPEDEPGRFSDEGPRHRVTITRGFWIGETPVTQDQRRAVVETMGQDNPVMLVPRPSHFKGPGTLPVENVSWEDCQIFIGQLAFLLASGEADRPGFRLPTEAEWEYACRAGTESALPSGGITLRGDRDAPELDDIAWYGGNSGQDLEVSNPYSSASDWKERQYPGPNAGTHRVGLKAPNRWGLYDTIGNVWEWCSDGRRDYAEGEIEDPFGPDGSYRVIRGGSWYFSARHCRSASRNGFVPGSRGDYLGFRLVLAPRSVS